MFGIPCRVGLPVTWTARGGDGLRPLQPGVQRHGPVDVPDQALWPAGYWLPSVYCAPMNRSLPMVTTSASQAALLAQASGQGGSLQDSMLPFALTR